MKPAVVVSEVPLHVPTPMMTPFPTDTQTHMHTDTLTDLLAGRPRYPGQPYRQTNPLAHTPCHTVNRRRMKLELTNVDRSGRSSTSWIKMETMCWTTERWGT